MITKVQREYFVVTMRALLWEAKDPSFTDVFGRQLKCYWTSANIKGKLTRYSFKNAECYKENTTVISDQGE